jgi:hypothetical protein
LPFTDRLFWVILRRFWDKKFCSHPDKVRKRFGLHLSHHLASMNLKRYLEDPQNACSLFVQEPSRQLLEGLLALAVSGVQGVPQTGQFGSFFQHPPFLSDCDLDRFDQSGGGSTGIVRSSIAPAVIARPAEHTETSLSFAFFSSFISGTVLPVPLARSGF